MKAVAIVLLVCLSAVLSAHIEPKLFPEHPVFAGKRRSPKIVGGEEATPHSIPYQCALFLDGYFCGGSLISDRWVLTAAHCGELTNQPQVVLGAHRVQENEPTQVVVNGRRPIIHPQWDSDTLKNDISLIELPQAVTLNPNIGVVQLANSNDGDYAGKNARASGWGLAYDGSTSLAPALRQVVSPVLTNGECQSQFGPGIPVYDTIICLDGSQGKSTCSGDSGGPLTVNEVQVGLTSYGVSLGCEQGFPAAFTRISSYRQWINQNANLISSAKLLK